MRNEGKVRDNRRNFDLYFSVILIFLVLTLINTYPLFKNLTTHQLGDGGDGTEFMWNFWWMKHSLTNLQNPYYIDSLIHTLSRLHLQIMNGNN